MPQITSLLCIVAFAQGKAPAVFDLHALPGASTHKLTVKTRAVIRDTSGKVKEQGAVQFVIRQSIRPVSPTQVEVTTKLLSHSNPTGTPKAVAEMNSVIKALTTSKPRIEDYEKQNTMPKGLIPRGKSWKNSRGRGGASSTIQGVLQDIVMYHGYPTAVVVETNVVSITSKGDSITNRRVTTKWISGRDHSIVKMQLVQDAKTKQGSQHSETSYESSN